MRRYRYLINQLILVLFLCNDIRTVFRDENHVLLLRGPGAVLVGKIGKSSIKTK